MIFQLLEIGTKITEISDLITNKWAEVLGWISIPTIGTALIVCLFKLITAKLSQKIAKKNIQPLVDEVEKAKTIFSETSENLKNEFECKLKEYENVVKNSIENGFATYEEKKNEVCAEIINADETLKSMVGEIEPKVINILEKCEDVKNEVLEIVEENVSEIIENQEELPKVIEENNSEEIKEVDPFAR